jgi:hypothetical protein
MTYDGHSKFAATPLLNTLHKDDANSLRGVALLMPAAGHWLPWGHLSNAIKTGEPQAMATLGRSAWEHLANTPAEAAGFTETMKSTSLAVNREAAKLVDTQSIRVAVDIGGASGTLIHSLMKENPALRGVVFDLPHVVPTAIKAAEDLGLQDRFWVVARRFLGNRAAACRPVPVEVDLARLERRSLPLDPEKLQTYHQPRWAHPRGGEFDRRDRHTRLCTPDRHGYAGHAWWQGAESGGVQKLCLLQQTFVFPASLQLRHHLS